MCSRRLALGGGLFEHAHDVGLLHDQELLAVDLHLGARPLAEQHPVADLEIDGDELAGLVAAARAHGDDLALRGLFLGGVGNDDAAGGLLLGIDALDDDAVVKRTEFHGYPPQKSERTRVGCSGRRGNPKAAWPRHKWRPFYPQGDAGKFLALMTMEC